MSIKIELPVKRENDDIQFWNVDISRITRIEAGPACLDWTTCWVYLEGMKMPIYCLVPKEEISP